MDLQQTGRSYGSDVLARKRILIVGIGGLGIPAACALVRAGFADLGLIDPDLIDLSNLPRQIIFGESDMGASKVSVAARHLTAILPGAAIEPMQKSLDAA